MDLLFPKRGARARSERGFNQGKCARRGGLGQPRPAEKRREMRRPGRCTGHLPQDWSFPPLGTPRPEGVAVNAAFDVLDRTDRELWGVTAQADGRRGGLIAT